MIARKDPSLAVRRYRICFLRAQRRAHATHHRSALLPETGQSSECAKSRVPHDLPLLIRSAGNNSSRHKPCGPRPKIALRSRSGSPFAWTREPRSGMTERAAPGTLRKCRVEANVRRSNYKAGCSLTWRRLRLRSALPMCAAHSSRTSYTSKQSGEATRNGQNSMPRIWPHVLASAAVPYARRWAARGSRRCRCRCIAIARRN